MLPSARQHGWGMMACGSFGFGLLTGPVTANTKFEEDDWRRKPQVVENLMGFPIFEGEHFVHSLEIVERLKKIAASQGKSIAQLAAAWVLSNPTVTVALTGARKPSEIEENAVAGDWKLTDEVKAELGQAFE